MTSRARSTTASAPTVGFRVKSGRALAVLLSGSTREPTLLHRCRIALADPKVPRSQQPYHASFGTLQKNATVLRRLVRTVYRTTDRSVAAFLRECRAQRRAPRAAALVVGSTIDPETIANEHIRAHAYEGQLFRTALAQALVRRRVPCRILRERELPTTAVAELGLPLATVRDHIATLGRVAGKPWRGEDKAAAIAAWLLLAPRNASTQRHDKRLQLTARLSEGAGSLRSRAATYTVERRS